MINYDQRGRAGMQFLGSLQHYASSVLLQAAQSDFDAQPECKTLTRLFRENPEPTALQKHLDQAKDVAQRSTAYRFNRFYQRYVAEENWVRAIAATERKREHFAALFKHDDRDADTADDHPRLLLDPNLQTPAYNQDVEWHLQPGGIGMEGYDLLPPVALGVVHHVFKRGGFAAVAVDDDISEQRTRVIKQFRKTQYRRIYDLGCGGVGTLGLIRKRFPEAELVGGDVSEGVLISGHRMSQAQGLNIVFRQEDACAVNDDDASYDGVISYAVHHELPEAVSRKVIREAFRILEPGGDMVISDPPPFRAVAPLHAVLLDWETENRVEPYFTQAGFADLAQMMRDAGFVDVEEYALQEKSRYPWITRGRKPQAIQHEGEE